MPDLTQSLQGRDLGHLRIIAQMWGLELNAPDTRVGLQRLVPAILERKLVAEIIHELPAAARTALEDLIQHEGRLPWMLFTRRYGLVRDMGASRRDRERPYAKSASPAEALWYRALVGRAFFDAPAGPEEFAYIPEDLLALIPAEASGRAAPLGRPATPAERAIPIPATDALLDQSTLLLAALRLGISMDNESGASGLPSADLKQLLSEAGLLDANAIPLPEPTRAFLETSRGEALARLARTWLNSSKFNELRRVPGLVCEGEWQNDPLSTRRVILDFLSTADGDKWWSLPAFVADIRLHHPDFQRPAGDYDSWFIRSTQTHEFLRGFEHWDEVDGALIRYLITGPLNWLGILDLALPAEGRAVAAFHFSAWAAALLHGAVPDGLPVEEGRIIARSDARLSVPRLAPRAVHYQIARFGEWEETQSGEYRYHLTPSSLARARQQGLTLNHLLALLRRQADSIPPTLIKALERWEQRGAEARVDQVLVLRVSTPEILQALRSSRAARFLGDPLGPTTIIVKPGAGEKVLLALAELGYLGEFAAPDN